MIKISGVYTALITPFDSNLEVDYEGLKRNVNLQIDAGVNGLLVLGTTGETPTLTTNEQRKVITTVIEEAKGRVPVIVGTGTNSTAASIERTAEAKKLGADAALIVTPYYNKPTQRGIYEHFRAINLAVDLPLIAYNIKGRSGVNIETSTLKDISELYNVVAVKEASGDISQIMDVITKLGSDDFSVMSGDDALTLPAMALGANGVFSVVSNLFPDRVVAMTEAALRGDFEEARALHYELLPFFRAAFIETNPIPIKAAMEILGLPAGKCRLPLCDLQPKNAEKLAEILKSYGSL